ncbi:MAG: hypothetical protein US62_C0024G0016 [Candidatus Woesebacteria bacterium GW2011_GWA1_37_8]|uniref:Uncharacterized protein n=1 Tax=Candidatus Woesebacteria bacterium GW2011_GWA1_37_8 TaxID=1618546 RepID=A0A0G0K6B3_9BACT|nr:MAG: hypothetical protein QT09_C0013G0019 [archaeon GW2011_AR18]KKQ44594.1 MAG: hypothetical protein US62_C0024G0016 [Candidatus Woesebacteria bacterium GW2011_GWA1_37_8]
MKKVKSQKTKFFNKEILMKAAKHVMNRDKKLLDELAKC